MELRLLILLFTAIKQKIEILISFVSEDSVKVFAVVPCRTPSSRPSSRRVPILAVTGIASQPPVGAYQLPDLEEPPSTGNVANKNRAARDISRAIDHPRQDRSRWFAATSHQPDQLPDHEERSLAPFDSLRQDRRRWSAATYFRVRRIYLFLHELRYISYRSNVCRFNVAARDISRAIDHHRQDRSRWFAATSHRLDQLPDHEERSLAPFDRLRQDLAGSLRWKSYDNKQKSTRYRWLGRSRHLWSETNTVQPMLIVKAEPGTTEVELETEAPEADESTPDPFGNIEPSPLSDPNRFCKNCNAREGSIWDSRLSVFPRKILNIYPASSSTTAGNTATETLISSLNEEGPKIVIKHNPANPGWTTCRVARQRATRVRASRRGRTHTRWVNLTVGLVDDYDGGSMQLGSLDVAEMEMVDLGGPIAATAGVCTTRDPRNRFRNRINNKDTLTSNSLSNIAEINSQRHFGLAELNRRRTDLEQLPATDLGGLRLPSPSCITHTMMTNAFLNPGKLRRDNSNVHHHQHGTGSHFGAYGSGPVRQIRQFSRPVPLPHGQPATSTARTAGAAAVARSHCSIAQCPPNLFIGEHHIGDRDSLQQCHLSLLLFLPADQVGSDW
ncbi:zinc finger protein [Culex quinquefasciatus]|uniref:Zinc finger protein n=1 Tax=Culex quinquefasciatus TaxID=7176 RepID=B0WCK4_CULQU|nr:zinc finger protein [Culex quinquefasciatus]|eukprot:XP_001846438.1 zinc finger protein [Culex quinquefasciatus]